MHPWWTGTLLHNKKRLSINLRTLIYIYIFYGSRVRSNCPRLLINKEKVGTQDRLSRLLGIRQGLMFDTKGSHGGRDVAWLGDCDTGSELLAEKMGWGVRFCFNITFFI